jgi:hypothetical protein
MRGIKEELGLDVEKLESTGTFRLKKRGQLMHGFIASVKKQEPVCSREIERKKHSDINCMKSGGWNDVEKISC